MGDSSSQQFSPPSRLRNMSSFLSMYSAADQPQFTLPESEDKLFVFWRQRAQASSNDAVAANKFVVHEKIKATFRDLQWFSSAAVLQFWSLETTANGNILSSENEPFALVPDPSRWNTRLASSCYRYIVDPNLQSQIGPPPDAYLSHLARVCTDLRAHQEWPLVATALECGFTSYFAVPVQDKQDNCVGVVDCYLENFDHLLSVSISLVGSLERQGLKFFNGHKNLPYEAIGGLKPAMSQMKATLIKICEAHDLTFAQCSMLDTVNNPPPTSSSTQAQLTKTMLALSLVVSCVDDDDDGGDGRLVFVDHCDSWDMNPLAIERRLAEKSIENNKPHFCSNIYDIPGLMDLPANSSIKKLSSLAICLRSTETEDRDIVFEFFWTAYRSTFTIIESIISRLRRFLPNFKFSSGEALGDPITVIDGGFLIFEGGMLLGEKGSIGDITRKDIEEQFSKTQKEAAKNLKLPMNIFKRKCADFSIDNWKRKRTKTAHLDQSGSIVVPSTSVTPDQVIIKAVYDNKSIKCHFPHSSTTVEAVKTQIFKKFELAVEGGFYLTYCDEENDMVIVFDDDDVKDLLKIRTTEFPKIIVNKKE